MICTVEIWVQCCSREKLRTLCGGEIEETEPDENRPTLILRSVGDEKSLWDIAKAYGTTMEEIRQANELEEGALPGNTMLLIPRAR